MFVENRDIITSWLQNSTVHSSWLPHLRDALAEMDPRYLTELASQNDWLPGQQKMFNAFCIPLAKVRYILMGESPYPRTESANGYAFWDANVGSLWSPNGLSKTVNRATSLRNILKMLLCAENLIKEPTQTAIAQLDKSALIATLDELFQKLLQQGFLLLNATLVLTRNAVVKDVTAWKPFIQHICTVLQQRQMGPPTAILLGKMAELLQASLMSWPILTAEHPYNVSFVTNQKVRAFFQPMHLLIR